jgi:protein-disulfide isomerase
MNRILLSCAMLAGLAIGTAQAEPEPVVTGLIPPLSASDTVLGKPDAPVTVVEYASMTCPHCAKWETEVFPDVRKNWVDTGKIRFVFRDYPLDGLALKGSQLARCTGDQRFWGFLQALFSSQRVWATASDPVAELVKIGKLGGVPEDKAKACMADDNDLSKSIVASLQAAQVAGVNSTPTFFFNGKLVSGEIPYDTFVKNVQEAAPSN